VELLKGTTALPQPITVPSFLAPQVIWIPDRNNIHSELYGDGKLLAEVSHGKLSEATFSVTINHSRPTLTLPGTGAWENQLNTDIATADVVALAHVISTHEY
jgi:hypothetical protein